MEIEWPDDLSSVTCSFYLQPHSVVSQSPFSRQRQVYGVSSPRFVVNATFNGSDASRGARLDALLAKIKGPQNIVTIYDWRRPDSQAGPSLTEWIAGFSGQTFTFDQGETFNVGERFIVEGVGEVVNNRAEAGATAMVFTGFGFNQIAFRAGYYIGGDGRPHVITEDSYADAEGRAVAYFEPPLKQAVPPGSAITQKVRGRFRLVSDDAGLNPTDVSHFSTYDLSFEEEL